MTPSIGPLPYRKVVRVLRNHGFQRAGQRGSPAYFRDARGRVVTVPRHDGKAIGAPLLIAIAKQAGMDQDVWRR